jgi:exodeoxyribonuclease V beta subunit
VTIHKSKGLEYPVVFCPFVWEGAKNVSKNDAHICHGGDENSFLLCDLGLPHQALHELRAYREGLAERVRLLYVALTRAKHRCYLVWGHFNRAGGSAPAYLFHDRTSKWDENNPEEAIAAAESFRNFYNELTGPEIVRDLDRIADSAHGSISIADLPVPTAVSTLQNQPWKGTLSRRNFTRKLEQSWRFTSFSSLVFGTYVPQEGADRDREEEYRPLKSSDWQVLPPGTQTGNLLHEFLEQLDFKERDEMVLQQRASEALSSHGFDSRWKTALLTLIRNVLALSLSGVGNGQSFRLSDICRGDRISELAFYFPLKRLTRDNLRILFQEISREDPGMVPDSWDLEMERLSFSPVRGWLRGFIDLVFVIDGRYYLLDWKSNFLGADPSGYSPEALKSVMVRKHYILQYHLYALALHAYLKQRLPGYRVERHFGGIYYLFLRGIDPSRGEKTGVYFDRPSEERLTALYDGLIEKNPAERRNADVA